ncbi:hypothetical protein [Ottowia thiooxydans]|nr:hypothetical protein [Ottowia thiooxydans]
MMAVAKDHADLALVLAEIGLMIVAEDAHVHGADAPEETAIP